MPSFKFEIDYSFDGQYASGLGGVDQEIETVMTDIYHNLKEEELKQHPLVWIFAHQFNEFLKNSIDASYKSTIMVASNPAQATESKSNKAAELKIEVFGDDNFFNIKITDQGKGFQKRTHDNNDKDYIDDLLNGELVDYDRVLKGATKLDSTKRGKNNKLGGEGLGLAGVHYFAQFFEAIDNGTLVKGRVFICNAVKANAVENAKHGCIIIRFPRHCLLNMKSVKTCCSRRPTLFVKDFMITHPDFPTNLSPSDESKGNIQDLSAYSKTAFNFPTPVYKTALVADQAVNLVSPTCATANEKTPTKKRPSLPFALEMTSIEDDMPPIVAPRQKVRPVALNLPTTTHKDISIPIVYTPSQEILSPSSDSEDTDSPSTIRVGGVKIFDRTSLKNNRPRKTIGGPVDLPQPNELKRRRSDIMF